MLYIIYYIYMSCSYQFWEVSPKTMQQNSNFGCLGEETSPGFADSERGTPGEQRALPLVDEGPNSWRLPWSNACNEGWAAGGPQTPQVTSECEVNSNIIHRLNVKTQEDIEKHRNRTGPKHHLSGVAFCPLNYHPTLRIIWTLWVMVGGTLRCYTKLHGE
jgi:hypothetical protein